MKKKMIQLLFAVVCGILVGVMVYSGWQILSDNLEHSSARSKDSGASTSFALSGSEAPVPRMYGEETAQGIPLDNEISPINSMYDLDKFFSEYPDAVGWIYSPDTLIDYGVVEAEDNDFYLHRFLDGSYSVSGSLFVDCNCPRDFSGANTVIYGHHMNDGTKFASLVNYRDAGYYEQHPVMYLSTRDMNYRVEIFAFYQTDADSDTYTFRFASDEDYAAYLQRMKSQSDYPTNVTVGPGDRIITLSTCSYEYYDSRYVVQGKLVPIH